MARVIAAHHPLAVHKSKRVLDDWAYSDAAFEAEFEASKACYEEGSALTGPKSFKGAGKTHHSLKTSWSRGDGDWIVGPLWRLSARPGMPASTSS